MPKVKRTIIVNVRVDVETSDEKTWNHIIDCIANGDNMPRCDTAGGGIVNKRGDVGSYVIRSTTVAQQSQFKRRYRIKGRT